MKRSTVVEWIESVASSAASSAPVDIERSHRDGSINEGPCKRSKHDHNCDHPDATFTHPYNTIRPLNTPPATESEAMTHQTTPVRRQKRRGEHDTNVEVDDRTPTQRQQRAQHSPRHRRSSPKKAKKDSNTRDYLLKLEAPVHIKPWSTDVKHWPGYEQIKCFYSRVSEASMWKRGIVPAEAREQLTAVYEQQYDSVPLFEYCFGAAELPSVDKKGLTPADRARAEFVLLLDVQEEAIASKAYQRNECGWNTHVYAPLLRHVFQREDRQETSVRVETIMTATMEGDSIPLKKGMRSSATTDTSGAVFDNDEHSDFCVTITASSTSSSLSGSVDNSRDIAHVQSRSDVKIVDYGLVMDLPGESALQRIISELVTNVCIESGRRHVNQTAYQAVQDSIIAVSIETKTELSAVDPLLQLGIWVAAWFKRMCFLRREIFAAKMAEVPAQNDQLLLQHRHREQQKHLVPVPLIAIIGHAWDLYFTFFNNPGQSITICGPVKMGSTESILDTYALVASLKALKEWIKTVFQAAMEDWFQV